MFDVGRETRLWYESLTHINVHWPCLQNVFRQQYSKIGNTREKLFHAWRSFHFDKNTETIDVYVISIRQVATPLGYRESQILEVFKNMFPTKYIECSVGGLMVKAFTWIAKDAGSSPAQCYLLFSLHMMA